EGGGQELGERVCGGAGAGHGRLVHGLLGGLDQVGDVAGEVAGVLVEAHGDLADTAAGGPLGDDPGVVRAGSHGRYGGEQVVQVTGAADTVQVTGLGQGVGQGDRVDRLPVGAGGHRRGVDGGMPRIVEIRRPD